MIDEYGTVVEKTDDEIAVRIEVGSSCDSCPVRKNCYGDERVVRLPRRGRAAEARVDDRVRLSIEKTSILGVSALVYGTPLLALVSGILIGYLAIFSGLAEDPRILAATGLGGALFAFSAIAVKRVGQRIHDGFTYRLERAPTVQPESSHQTFS